MRHCTAECHIADDHGDNHATCTCQLEADHSGPHVERFRLGPQTSGTHDVLVEWFGDDREKA